MIGDSAVGIVGAIVSDWLLLRFHYHFGGGVTGLFVRTGIGAIAVVFILMRARTLGQAGRGGARNPFEGAL
jgi:uncharacterized membrane protein YeaQ/YmgE (transglycosylase-associated protein family)